MRFRIFTVAGVMALATFSCSPVVNSPVTSREDHPSWMFVLSSDSAKVTGSVLELTPVAPVVLQYTDRPVRDSSRVPTSAFVRRWKSLFGSDSPNAVFTWADGAGHAAAVVTLSEPKSNGKALSFTVAALPGQVLPTETVTFTHLLVDPSDIGVPPSPEPEDSPTGTEDLGSSKKITIHNPSYKTGCLKAEAHVGNTYWSAPTFPWQTIGDTNIKNPDNLCIEPNQVSLVHITHHDGTGSGFIELCVFPCEGTGFTVEYVYDQAGTADPDLTWVRGGNFGVGCYMFFNDGVRSSYEMQVQCQS